MRYKTLILLFIFSFLSQSAFTQKLDERRLNLYKPGVTKILPYKVGDTFTFKMKDFEHYYSFKITDLRNDSIMFDNRVVRLHQIASIKYPRSSENFAKSAARSLYVFGGSWLFYTGVDDVMGNDPSWIRAGVIAATAGALGFIVQQFTRPKTYVLDDDRYLRILTP
ncbi:MAG: hypothetical protein AB8G11_23935 [Saprospiraceae bacterium]